MTNVYGIVVPSNLYDHFVEKLEEQEFAIKAEITRFDQRVVVFQEPSEAMFCQLVFGSFGELDWVIVGGESGHGARPMDFAWARTVRDQCQVAGVIFNFKQTGSTRGHGGKTLDGRQHYDRPIVSSTSLQIVGPSLGGDHD